MTASADQLQAIERWFMARGTPHLIEDYSATTDVFTRMQSSTKASTLGLGCLLLGLILLHPSAEFIIGSIASSAPLAVRGLT